MRLEKKTTLGILLTSTLAFGGATALAQDHPDHPKSDHPQTDHPQKDSKQKQNEAQQNQQRQAQQDRNQQSQRDRTIQWYDPGQFNVEAAPSYTYGSLMYGPHEWWGPEDHWYDDYDWRYEPSTVSGTEAEYRWDEDKQRWVPDDRQRLQTYTPDFKGERQQVAGITGREMTYRGTIKDVQKIEIQRAERVQQDLLARIDLEDGSSCVVDLGPNANLQDFGLRKGDTVVVRGDTGTINDRLVIFADRVIAVSDIDRSRMGDQQRQRFPGQLMEMYGTIDSWERTTVTGQDREHTLIRVKLEDGNTRTINLGPELTVRDLGLQKGDRISVKGRRGTLHQREAIMATEINVDGERYEIRPAIEGRQIDRQREVTMTGRADDFRQVRFEGQRDRHNLLRIRMDNGRTAAVNLGPNVDVQELGIKPGARITVKGRQGTVDGRTILVAEEVDVDGETTRIRWPQGQQGQQQQMRAWRMSAQERWPEHYNVHHPAWNPRRGEADDNWDINQR